MESPTSDSCSDGRVEMDVRVDEGSDVPEAVVKSHLDISLLNPYKMCVNKTIDKLMLCHPNNSLMFFFCLHRSLTTFGK